MYRKAIELNPEVVFFYNNLGILLSNDEKRYDEAERISRETLPIEQRALGSDNPDVGETMYNLACIAAQQGRKNEAFLFLRDSVEHGLKTNIALTIDDDPMLKPLRGDSRFRAIVSLANELAAVRLQPH